MRIVIAPDKFKSCLSAQQVAEAIADGLKSVDPAVEIDLCPMADGGEGTVDALVAATGGKLITRRVTGPLPDMKVEATFGILGQRAPDSSPSPGTPGEGRGEGLDYSIAGSRSEEPLTLPSPRSTGARVHEVTAVIEMAAASGLQLLKPEQRNPMNTTTYGTGELLMAAAELGAKHIILGIGGSATTDAGLGCVQACGGIPVLDDQVPLDDRPIVGRDVGRMLWLTWDDRFAKYRVRITAACDVTNPLTGPNGAAHVFGPQKGASPAEVEQLDAALDRLVRKMRAYEKAETPGAGAAGGLGFGLIAFLGAGLKSGIDIVIDAVRLRERIKGSEFCITGEGRFDTQSLAGKTPIGVARICRELHVPCILIAGSIDPQARGAGAEQFRSLGSICEIAQSGEDSFRDAAALLTRAGRAVISTRS